MHDLFFAICQCQKPFSTVPIKMHQKIHLTFFPTHIFEHEPFEYETSESFMQWMAQKKTKLIEWRGNNAECGDDWCRVMSESAVSVDYIYIHSRGRLLQYYSTFIGERWTRWKWVCASKRNKNVQKIHKITNKQTAATSRGLIIYREQNGDGGDTGWGASCRQFHTHFSSLIRERKMPTLHRIERIERKKWRGNERAKECNKTETRNAATEEKSMTVMQISNWNLLGVFDCSCSFVSRTCA